MVNVLRLHINDNIQEPTLISCDGKSAVQPRNLWVRGSKLTGGSQPAKLLPFGGYSLESLTLI